MRIFKHQKTSPNVDYATIVGSIRSGLASIQTLASTSTQNTLNLSVIREQWGIGFSQEANAIRITAGINKVIASGQIYWFENIGNSNSLVTQTIERNREPMAVVNGRMGTEGSYQALPFGTIIFDVAEGDVISMTARNRHQANSTIGVNATSTWLQLIGLRVPAK